MVPKVFNDAHINQLTVLFKTMHNTGDAEQMLTRSVIYEHLMMIRKATKGY